MSKVTLHPAWKQAVANFLSAGFTPGDLIPKRWFYDNFGISEPTDATPAKIYEKAQFEFLQSMEPFRKELLLGHNIDLRNVRSSGWRWVPAFEQTRTAFSDGMKGVYKEIKGMAQRVNHVDLAALSAAQRKENDEAQVRIARLSGMLNSTRRLPRS